MDPHRYVSSYLAGPRDWRRGLSLGWPHRVVPRGAAAAARVWWPQPPRRRRRLLAAWRLRPRLARRTQLGLALWSGLLSIGLYAFGHHSLPVAPGEVAAAAGSAQMATPAPMAQLASAKVSALPSGPTGQLLPPGALAPAYTYANRYARGQCTWYVAGRRPIPNGWGNASSWLARARAAGWATGTTPAIGAIAWTAAGSYGHVALVEAVDVATGQVLISEMNYLGVYEIDKRWVSSAVFRYIY